LTLFDFCSRRARFAGAVGARKRFRDSSTKQRRQNKTNEKTENNSQFFRLMILKNYCLKTYFVLLANFTDWAIICAIFLSATEGKMRFLAWLTESATAFAAAIFILSVIKKICL